MAIHRKQTSLSVTTKNKVIDEGVMFGRSDNEFSTISEYIGKKGKLLKKKNKITIAKIEQAIRGEHKHYFSKQDLLSQNENARCKVCKMLLSEFRVKKKMENWSPHLRPVHQPPAPAEKK